MLRLLIPSVSVTIYTDYRQTAEIKRGGKRIHHLFQFRKPGDPACDRSPWRGMGNLCQRFPECTDDPDVDPRTVTDGGEGRN